MNTEEIIDYVMNTPHNTNKAILRQMIEANGGSGNMFEVIFEQRYDSNGKVYSCTRTFQEIKEAWEGRLPIICFVREYDRDGWSMQRLHSDIIMLDEISGYETPAFFFKSRAGDEVYTIDENENVAFEGGK